MESPQNELIEFTTRAWAYIGSVMVGVIAKISTEVLMKRKLSFMQWLAIVGVSVFFGYISAVWCDNRGWEEQAKYIVPLATLMGEKIMIYLSANYHKIIDNVVSIFKHKP